MNENQIADIWLLIKEYVDKKVIADIAERYIDLLADNGISDRILKESMGYDEILDDSIQYYLGITSSEDNEVEEIQDNWGYDEDE